MSDRAETTLKSEVARLRVWLKYLPLDYARRLQMVDELKAAREKLRLSRRAGVSK